MNRYLIERNIFSLGIKARPSYAGLTAERAWCNILNADEPLSRKRIDAYRARFEKSDSDDQSRSGD